MHALKTKELKKRVDYKPGFVEDNHSSGISVTTYL